MTGVLYPNCSEIIDGKKSFEENVQLVIAKKGAVQKHDRMKICRTLIYNTLIKRNPIPNELYRDNAKVCIEAFGHLKKEVVVVNLDFYNSELLKLYQFANENNVVGNFRKLVCKIDDWIYRNDS